MYDLKFNNIYELEKGQKCTQEAFAKCYSNAWW